MGIKKSDHQQTSFEEKFAGGRSNGRKSCSPGLQATGNLITSSSVL
jgi:hypothetical protein